MILVEVEMWCMFHNLDSCFPIWNHILFDNISVTLLQIHKEKENYRELNGLQSAPTSDAIYHITRTEEDLGKTKREVRWEGGQHIFWWKATGKLLFLFLDRRG